MSTLPSPCAPGALAQALVQDLEGQSVALGTLWATRPLALVFVRHFG